MEAGETLLVEYLDIIGSWTPLTTLTSDGTDEDTFSRVRISMPRTSPQHPRGLPSGRWFKQQKMCCRKKVMTRAGWRVQESG